MEQEFILNIIEDAKVNGLTELNLSNYQLTSLPSEIGKLTKLTTLNISSNELTSLPSEIGKLTKLTTLNISRNQLTSLPSEIRNLTNLNKLDLFENQLTSLPPEIGKLTKLNWLYLSNNQLTFLPPEIGNLTNLTWLHVSNNQLTFVPAEIGNLTKLTELDLFENQITSFRQEIEKLTNLQRINGKHVMSLPPEIVDKGVRATFQFLRKLSVEKIEVNEAKLILVGQGDVGKTCLANRLVFSKYIENETTKGIDISEWRINAPTVKKESIKLNVWDFGGQEIYHATHQFFLTKRSLYLLVWNARKSKDYEHIYYWLHTIEAFGEESPIILVMSKLNERDEDLNMKDLKEKFPQIVGLYKVDSKEGSGIPTLNEIISKHSWDLPHMRTPWIGSWFNVREQLEIDGRDWIDYNEFTKICKSQELDQEQIEALDGFLHDLGVIIHFTDRIGLRDMVILNSDWATKAFYNILDTQSVRDRGGILLHSELEQIWDVEIYPQNVYPRLLELMNKFELAYELPDKTSHLVAELLPTTDPEFEWNEGESLNFYYCYDFLPAGVMTRFIVLVHQDLETLSDGKHLCWKEGAVLQKEGARAFIKVKPLERLIHIKINGDNKRELLAIIKYQFDHINSSIKKIKITKEIPCNCSDACDHRFNYEQLLMAEKVNKNNVDCPVSWNEVSLSSLLDGYELKENRLKETEKILKKGDKNIYFNNVKNAVYSERDTNTGNINRSPMKLIRELINSVLLKE